MACCRPLLPAVGRGNRRVDDRRVVKWHLCTTNAVAWRDLPERHGQYTTVYNRFNRRAKKGE
ncbi:MAG: transposase [Janthinobacterium lividum]